MGKKNKKSPKAIKSIKTVSRNNFIVSFEDEIIQYLPLLKEAGGLVVGLNAVLRGLRKKHFCAVIFISRKATSAMYHALNMMCKSTDAVLLQIQDINSNTLKSKVPISTAYGIKASILIDQKKFPKLIEKINSSRKSWKDKNTESTEQSNDNDIHGNCSQADANQFNNQEAVEHCNPATENLSQIKDVNNILHPKHKSSVENLSIEGYLSLSTSDTDFPNYRTKSKGISFCIKYL